MLDASKIDRDSQRYQDSVMYSDFLDQTDGTPREKVIVVPLNFGLMCIWILKQAGISSLTQVLGSSEIL